ncbi:MAG: hypothetical protein OEO83_06770 [Alphaproteobacteria bacterium]|nr:hypothetical protein [Alphaproteobacteria bacterium]
MSERSGMIADGLWRRYKLGRDRLRAMKRQILRARTAPELARRHSAYSKAVARRDWRTAQAAARDLARSAVAHHDRRVLQEMMHALERLDCYGDIAPVHRAWREALSDGPRKPWRGDDLAGKTLMIDFTERHEKGLGVALSGASLAAKAAWRAARTIVVVEPRLVPLFRRSLPGVEVRDTATGDAEEIDFIATRGDLIGDFLPKAAGDDPEFQPLAADREKTAVLRARYLAGSERPLIGLFWRSSHFGKDLPGLDDWARFIAGVDGDFVSLQYGDVTDDIAALGADRVILDPTIDQMSDMDGFAAQVAALDAVVGISGTPIHLAGALGVPTLVLRDDWFRRQWSVMSDRVPWYPALRVVGKDGRPWRAVLEEARETLGTLLGAGRGGRS